MANEWLLTKKPAFLNEGLVLRPKEFPQVQKKPVSLTETLVPLWEVA